MKSNPDHIVLKACLVAGLCFLYLAITGQLPGA